MPDMPDMPDIPPMPDIPSIAVADVAVPMARAMLMAPAKIFWFILIRSSLKFQTKLGSIYKQLMSH